MQKILYLHGFHSSPNSEKTTTFKNYVAEQHTHIEVIAPQLPCKPAQVKERLVQLTQEHDFTGVIGSSLGGYLATYLHNELAIPAVVINPAVKPFELLHDYLGEQTHPITEEKYELNEQDMNELKALYQLVLKQPEQIWLLQQEKDEVLDYREALSRYQDCKITFELGGNHSFLGFDRHVAQIIEFFDPASTK
jgi:predicted esterase YcpF (UPF0227 family)